MAFFTILNMASFKNVMISTTIFILLVMNPSATSLSFSFTNFALDDGSLITYEASASAANGMIQLTINKKGPAPVGRATYSEPLHLWDRASGNLADFETHFSFSINSLNEPVYADGMTFFLAPNGTKVPENPVSAGGQNIGLSTYEPFVAVEFDTFSNDFDPPYTHVGIDVNSLQSVVLQRWWTNTSIMQGRRQEAAVRYTAQSNNFSVIFTYWGNGNWITQELSYTINLRDYMPEFVTFGFSASTGITTELHTLYSWNFSSNLVPDPRAVTRNNKTVLRIIGLSVAGLVVVLSVLGLVYCFWKKMFCFRNEIQGTHPRVGNHEDSILLERRDETSTLSAIFNQVQQDTTPTQFTYNDLKEATDNFANENLLGRGAFGSVYKGHLGNSNSDIAVKRIYSNSEEGAKGYAAEVKTISRLIHKNLVRLRGWCHENKQELLLVYEFMPNGSLDCHLFNGTSLSSWGLRLQIAKDLADVLDYLHDGFDSNQCVLHRDIKSSNIMLDANFKVKLGDFGLARLVDHEKGSDTTVLAGTFGYMAPELLMDGAKASRETDVYSFGVVALELATGKKAIHGVGEQSVSLVEWARSLHGMEQLHEAADPGLASDHNMGELLRLMTVGLWCAHRNSSLRPSIKEAALMLKGAPLPVLSSPFCMHSSQYVTAGSSSSSRTMSGDTTESSRHTEYFSGASSS